MFSQAFLHTIHGRFSRRKLEGSQFSHSINRLDARWMSECGRRVSIKICNYVHTSFTDHRAHRFRESLRRFSSAFFYANHHFSVGMKSFQRSINSSSLLHADAKVQIEKRRKKIDISSNWIDWWWKEGERDEWKLLIHSRLTSFFLFESARWRDLRDLISRYSATTPNEGSEHYARHVLKVQYFEIGIAAHTTTSSLSHTRVLFFFHPNVTVVHAADVSLFILQFLFLFQFSLSHISQVEPPRWTATSTTYRGESQVR